MTKNKCIESNLKDARAVSTRLLALPLTCQWETGRGVLLVSFNFGSRRIENWGCRHIVQ